MLDISMTTKIYFINRVIYKEEIKMLSKFVSTGNGILGWLLIFLFFCQGFAVETTKKSEGYETSGKSSALMEDARMRVDGDAAGFYLWFG